MEHEDAVLQGGVLFEELLVRLVVVEDMIFADNCRGGESKK